VTGCPAVAQMPTEDNARPFYAQARVRVREGMSIDSAVDIQMSTADMHGE